MTRGIRVIEGYHSLTHSLLLTYSLTHSLTHFRVANIIVCQWQLVIFSGKRQEAADRRHGHLHAPGVRPAARAAGI